jgi:hypothetical protein
MTYDHSDRLANKQAAVKLIRTQRRQFEKLAARIDKVIQADRFFERFSNRQHRVRLAAHAEIELDAPLTGVDLPVPREFSYFMAVKNIARGVRVRLRPRIIGLEGSDTDISEEIARAIRSVVMRGSRMISSIAIMARLVSLRVPTRACSATKRITSPPCSVKHGQVATPAAPRSGGAFFYTAV